MSRFKIDNPEIKPVHFVNVSLQLMLNHKVPRGKLKQYIQDALEYWQGSLFSGNEELDTDLVWQAIRLVDKVKIVAPATKPQDTGKVKARV